MLVRSQAAHNNKGTDCIALACWAAMRPYVKARSSHSRLTTLLEYINHRRKTTCM